MGTYAELLAQGHDFHVLLHREDDDEVDAEELDAIEEEGEEGRRVSVGESARKSSYEEVVLSEVKVEKGAYDHGGQH